MNPPETKPRTPIPAHPTAFEPQTLLLTVALAAVGSFIGIHLITQLGISTHTSVIGALIAMLIGRLKFGGLRRFRDVHRQNLAQTAISSGTLGAANALIAPLALAWAFNRPDLIWPMLIGAAGGMFVDAWILYRSFGSKLMAASNAWPPGVAAAEAIKAGDQGGRRALVLVGGGVIGFAVSWLGLSASAAGVALIGNAIALTMFGIGLLVAQYYNLLPGLADFNLAKHYIPHGIMIGAGVVALSQAAVILVGRRRRNGQSRLDREVDSVPDGGQHPSNQDDQLQEPQDVDPALAETVSARQLGRGLGGGFALFIAVAILLAIVSGLWAQLSVPMLIGWVVFAAIAALVSEIIVGLAAMHAGWFPATAITLIFLVLGLVLGFPPVPLVMLVGYTMSTGPAFADMGYDLKAGWILRRVYSRHPNYGDYERSGRKQQFYSAMIGFVVALAMAAWLWQPYFSAGKIPPVAVVYADTIRVGMGDTSVLTTVVLWGVLGAVLQLIGGAKRQMGIMLATGLLIAAPYAGWLVLGALLIRVCVRVFAGKEREQDLQLIGAGIITGDAFASFGGLLR